LPASGHLLLPFSDDEDLVELFDDDFTADELLPCPDEPDLTAGEELLPCPDEPELTAGDELLEGAVTDLPEGEEFLTGALTDLSEGADLLSGALTDSDLMVLPWFELTVVLLSGSAGLLII
jgi:hypothetical protein